MKDSNHWGVELIGSELDQGTWKDLLKPPFDPCVQEVKEDDPPCLVLRSTAFDGITTSSEVFDRAEMLFRCLNMAMAANSNVDPVTPGSVIEFAENGAPRRHFRHRLVEAEGGIYRLRGAVVALTLRDAQGDIVEPTPIASTPQKWMRAAGLHPGVATAMRYLFDTPGWVDLYKAYEELEHHGLGRNAVSASKIKLFTQTANAAERHREGKVPLPKKPMALWEARSLMITRLAAAAEEVLGRIAL